MSRRLVLTVAEVEALERAKQDAGLRSVLGKFGQAMGQELEKLEFPGNLELEDKQLALLEGVNDVRGTLNEFLRLWVV